MTERKGRPVIGKVTRWIVRNDLGRYEISAHRASGGGYLSGAYATPEEARAVAMTHSRAERARAT